MVAEESVGAGSEIGEGDRADAPLLRIENFQESLVASSLSPAMKMLFCNKKYQIQTA
jgi:hypothetical protein